MFFGQTVRRFDHRGPAPDFDQGGVHRLLADKSADADGNVTALRPGFDPSAAFSYLIIAFPIVQSLADI